MLKDPDARVMYIECQGFGANLLNDVRKMHTDFFAFKSSAMNGTLLKSSDIPEAETSFTRQMLPFIGKNQHRHIPNVYPVLRGSCRMNGNLMGPVFHFHDDFGWTPRVENGICPAYFH